MAKSRNQELFVRLRQEYPIFNYESFNLKAIKDELIIEFNFNIDGKYYFHPTAKIKTGKLVNNLSQKVEQIRPLLENLAFNIGMIELISYWKAACPPIIQVMPAKLTTDQVNWWKKLYFNGLGEFFYLNSIQPDIDDFLNIKSLGLMQYSSQPIENENKYLIPIGGGKDSAVTLSILKVKGDKISPLIMNPRGATIETVKAAGLSLDDTILIYRTIDPALIDLNNQGFLNGHTPFSAMLAFYTLICSALSGYKNIVLSNEGSANESTIPGTGINHQYSKSLEFEKDFRFYYNEYISGSFNYFSLLRPLSELQIAKIFSKFTEYHNVFRSCNEGSKTNSWCGKCPKCLFTYFMLSAFQGLEEADRIIGKEMLNDPENEITFNELTGFASIKPFDCVGTTLEVKQALVMIVNQQKKRPLPYLLSRFVEKMTENIPQPDFDKIEDAQFVPDNLVHLLKSYLQ